MQQHHSVVAQVLLVVTFVAAEAPFRYYKCVKCASRIAEELNDQRLQLPVEKT